MTVVKTTWGRALGLGLSAAVVGLGSLAVIGSTPAMAAVVTLSPNTGAGDTTSSVKTVVAVTGTGFMNAAKVSQISTVVNMGVLFTSAACPSTRPAAAASTATVVLADKVSVSSATRLIVTTPATLTTGLLGVPKAWNVCVYKIGTAAAAIGTGTFTVYSVPTLAASGAVDPAMGGVAGGETVTVTGTGFTSKTTAKLDGNPLTGISVATGGLSFTALVPAGTAGTADLVVTTEGGPSTANGSAVYTYNNSVKADPASGWNDGSAATTVTLTGAGFETTFASANTGAGVLFLPSAKTGAAYTAPSDAVIFIATADVTVVSDNEIVFDIPATGTGAAALSTIKGAYNLVVTSNKATAGASTLTSTSSGSTFSLSSY